MSGTQQSLPVHQTSQSQQQHEQSKQQQYPSAQKQQQQQQQYQPTSEQQRQHGQQYSQQGFQQKQQQYPTSEQQRQQKQYAQHPQQGFEQQSGQQQYSSQIQNVDIRQNFDQNVEHMINQLVNVFLTGSYRCKSMATYFDREDKCLFGVADLHRWSCLNDAVCAKGLLDYLTVRGGNVQFEDIPKPDQSEWGSSVDSLVHLLQYKKDTYEQVLKLYQAAEKSNDPHLTDFLESNYIRTLVNFIRKLGILISNAQCAGDGLGEYEFNKDCELNLANIVAANKLVHLPGWDVTRT